MAVSASSLWTAQRVIIYDTCRIPPLRLSRAAQLNLSKQLSLVVPAVVNPCPALINHIDKPSSSEPRNHARRAGIPSRSNNASEEIYEARQRPQHRASYPVADSYVNTVVSLSKKSRPRSPPP